MTHFSTFSFYTNNCNVIWILDFLECAGSLSCYEPSRSRQYFVPRSSSKIYFSYQTNQIPQVLYNATTHFSPRTEESCTTKIVAKTLHPSGVNLYKWTIRHLAADLPDDAAVFVSRVHFDLHAVETRGVIVAAAANLYRNKEIRHLLIRFQGCASQRIMSTVEYSVHVNMETKTNCSTGYLTRNARHTISGNSETFLGVKLDIKQNFGIRDPSWI